MVGIGTAEEDTSIALLAVHFDEVGIFKGGGLEPSMPRARRRSRHGGIVMGWGWRVGVFLLALPCCVRSITDLSQDLFLFS